MSCSGSNRKERLCQTNAKTARAGRLGAASLNCRTGGISSSIQSAGLRIGEALALTWDDIDFDAGLITVCKTMAYKPGEDGQYDY